MPAPDERAALGADGGDEQPADPRPDEERQTEDRLVHAVGAVERPPGAPRCLGEHRFAGGGAGGVEDRPKDAKPASVATVSPPRESTSGIARTEAALSRSERSPARRRPTRSMTSRQQGGDEQRQGGGGRDDARGGGAPGALEDQPGQRDARDPVADPAHEGGGLQQQHRPARPRGGGARRDLGCHGPIPPGASPRTPCGDPVQERDEQPRTASRRATRPSRIESLSDHSAEANRSAISAAGRSVRRSPSRWPRRTTSSRACSTLYQRPLQLRQLPQLGAEV